MPTKLLKLTLVVAVSTIGIFAADNSLGTWTRDVAKTKVTPTPVSPVKSQTIVREAVNGGGKHTSKTERMDGVVTESTFTAKYDGKAVPVTGNGSYDTISWEQVTTAAQSQVMLLRSPSMPYDKQKSSYCRSDAVMRFDG